VKLILIEGKKEKVIQVKFWSMFWAVVTCYATFQAIILLIALVWTGLTLL